MLVEIIGTAGACLLLLAYYVVSRHRLPSDSNWVHALNLGGAVMLGANTVSHGALPAATLNLLWALIALAAIVRRVRTPHTS